MRSLAIFDIDGTLHKTEIMSAAAFSEIMPELGLPVPSLDTLKKTYGLGTQAIYRLLQIPKDLIPRWEQLFFSYESRHISLCATAYEGAIEALHTLHDSGVALALCSMCPQGYMDAIIDRFGIGDLIDYARNETHSQDKGELVRQLLEQSSASAAVMVGDRSFDIEAADINGIASVGCLYGYGPDEAAKATLTVSTAWQIPDVVMQLLRQQSALKENSAQL